MTPEAETVPTQPHLTNAQQRRAEKARRRSEMEIAWLKRRADDYDRLYGRGTYAKEEGR